jgi:hypothetical protein
MSFFADPLGNISGAVHDVGKGISNLTKNPLVDMAAAAALDYFTGGAAGVLGETGAMGSITGLGAAGNAALLTGGIAGLASGNLAQGLMAGLAGYTGARAGESLGMGGYGTTPTAAPTTTPAPSATPTGPTPTNPVNAPANVAGDLAPNPAQGLKPNFTPTAADSPYSIAPKTVTQMPDLTGATAKTSLWQDFKALPTWEQAAIGVGGIGLLKAAAQPQKLNAPTQPNTQFIRSYNYSPFGGYSFQGSTPAVGGGMAPGGLVALASGGGVHHYDDGGDVVTADSNTPAPTNTAPADLAPAVAVNPPTYTNYTPSQIGAYIQQSGINLNDPAAIAAAEKAQNADPAAVNAFLASTANPFSSASLLNPTNATAANVSAFDKSLGTAGANMDINNAITTAYKDTGATSNLASNIAGNTQIAQEMDTWNVPPAQMAAETGQPVSTIQALYDAVNPNGKYASRPSTVIPTGGSANTGITMGTVTTQNGTVLNTATLPNGQTVTLNPVNRTTENVSAPTGIATAPAGALASGVGGMNAVVNPNGTITQTATTPAAPGIQAIMNAYTKGGGSLGYTNPTYNNIAEFNAKNDTQTSGSKAAYDYLMGKSPYPSQPTGAPYQSTVLGQNLSPAYYAANPYIYDPTTKAYIANPKFDPAFSASYDALGKAQVGITPDTANMLHYAKLPNGIYGYPNGDGTFTGIDGKKYDSTGKDLTVVAAGGGLLGLAAGGMSVGHLGGYSDGGRLLRGPGDGVSDSIPATIGSSDPEPARLADGEFVVPARIVSELGNGSTEAGARQLYKMMDRIQKARSKTTGKDAVATNTNAHQYLPA